MSANEISAADENTHKRLLCHAIVQKPEKQHKNRCQKSSKFFSGLVHRWHWREISGQEWGTPTKLAKYIQRESISEIRSTGAQHPNPSCRLLDVWLKALQRRNNGRDGVSNHQPHHCLLNSLFRCRSKKTSKLRVTGLCVGNSPITGEFPAQRASNAESVSIWWRHHEHLHAIQ